MTKLIVPSAEWMQLGLWFLRARVPVFYNPTNPVENLGLCAASCKLRMD